MEPLFTRPIISGVLGGIVGYWILRSLAHRVPTGHSGKSASQLVAENRWRIRFANALFALGIISGIVMFKGEYVASNDWRAFGIVVGASFLAPVLLLVGTTLSQGQGRAGEALIAYSISQKTPPWVLYGAVALAAAGFVAAIVAVARAA